MRKRWIALCVAAGVLLPHVAAALAYPGNRSKRDFHGFARYDFRVKGQACVLVAPGAIATGRPWVWRARFFGHEPQTDTVLLERGYHVAYVNVAGLFGAPAAVKRWDEFYGFLTTELGFSKKPVLEGMSRGGLIVYNWAAKNPDKVSCIYADAPVLDIRSWPGGKGRGRGSAKTWRACLKVYGLKEGEALEFKGNPLDNLEPLAKAGVPLLHVCGDADAVVPIEENTGILEERYRKLGGTIKVIRKPGVGHHPHSLRDPTPIVAFIEKHTRGESGSESSASRGGPQRWPRATRAGREGHAHVRAEDERVGPDRARPGVPAGQRRDRQTGGGRRQNAG